MEGKSEGSAVARLWSVGDVARWRAATPNAQGTGAA